MELSCAFMGYTYKDNLTYKVTWWIIATVLLSLSLPTFTINITIIIAILRKRELHTPPFIVISNLAVSDSLTACIAFIFYSTVCIKFSLGYDACSVAYFGTSLSFIFGLTSYNTIALQTIERYLAIFHPYWYHEKFTTKVIIIANTTTWISSIGLVTMWLVTQNNRIFNGIIGTLSLISFCITMVSYLRIFREVRKIEKHIKEHQVSSLEEQKKIKSESKVARATVIILLAVTVCYTPLIFFEFYIAFIGEKNTFISVGLYWTWLLALLNSSINPIIACRQLTVLRRSVKHLLSWIPCWKSQIAPLDGSTSFARSNSKTSFAHPKTSQIVFTCH